MKQRPSEAHIALCDLLHGRWMRGRAWERLLWALQLERWGFVDEAVEELAGAAHYEWMANIAEQGKLAWGQRNNRCGRPEDYD